jgi:phytoene dehydrogenase-like protein
MGAVSAALERSARSFGCEIRTSAPVERVIVKNGEAAGVVVRGGEELEARAVVTCVHPKIAFLRHLDRKDLPEDFVTDIERWKSRSGVVKVNLALSELPDFKADPGTRPRDHHSGSVELCLSTQYAEQAFQDAKAGRAAQRPFVDGTIPTYWDKTLAPEGFHIFSMFTQWVPCDWNAEPHRDELERYAERIIDGYTELAPNFRKSVLHRQVLGPYDMEQDIGLIGGNIFHGELSAEQLFHMRPAPGYADFRTPIRGLYQASSATHGGGGVTGIPAYQAVRQMRRDGYVG